MYKDAVRESYGNNIRIFDQTIPNYSKIAEAPNEGHSVLWYEPKGIPADIYISIAETIREENYAEEISHITNII